MTKYRATRRRAGGIGVALALLWSLATPATATPGPTPGPTVGGTANPVAPASVLRVTPGLLSPATPTDPSDPTRDGVEILLEEISPQVIRPGDTITFSGTVVNHTGETLTGVVVSVQMQRHVPTDDGLTAWLDDESSRNTAVIARTTLSDPVESRAPFEISLGEGESPFMESSTWGPHGVELVVRSSGGSDSTRSTMTWFPSQVPRGTPASLVTLAPLQPTVDEWDTALVEDVTLAEAAADRLHGVLGELRRAPVTWAVDPVLLEAVPVSTKDISRERPDVSSSSAPEADTPQDQDATPAPDLSALATELADGTEGRPVLDLGYGAPDYQALLSAGSDNRVGSGDDAAGQRLLDGGAERAGELFAAASLPTIDDAFWPGVSLSDEARVALAGGNGEVISSSTRGTTSALTLLPEGAGTHLTGQDRLSADLLRERDGEGLREFVARSALAARAAPDTPILLTLPRSLTPDQGARAATALSQLSGLPWFTPRELPDITEDPTPAADLQPPPDRIPTGGALSAQEITALAADAALVSKVAALTEDPSTFGGGYLPELYGATGAAWRDHPEQRTVLIDEVRERSQRLRDAITVETPSTINLISRGGQVPITVANSLPQAVTVTVRLTPADARLRAEETTSAQLPAEAAATVRVPVHAVANGNVDVSVHVLDAAGQDVADATDFSIRVRADWEDTGTAIVAGALLALFLFGLTRTIRRGPRRMEDT